MYDGSISDEATDGGCVVLVRRGSTLSPDLLATCVHRGWRPDVFDDPYVALAELCVARRRAGDGRGLELVLDGLADPRSDRLMAAARRFVPDVSVWRHQDGALHQLPPPASTALPAYPAPTSTGAPTATPAIASAATSLDSLAPLPDDEPIPPTRVTADEIALLFAEPRGAGS